MRTFRRGHYVGTYLRHDGRPYLCCAYDPDSDYFVCTVDDGPARFANISTRAIGRTYHEDYHRKPFGRPDVLVAVVRLAYLAEVAGDVEDAQIHSKPHKPVDLAGIDEQMHLLINDLYWAARRQFAAWKAEHDEYYRKRAEESEARERAERMRPEADEPRMWHPDPWMRGYR